MTKNDHIITDVLVVGAGAAGIPAAIAAARAGAKVMLIEDDPYVGGAPTDMFVTMFCGGPVTGIVQELRDRLKNDAITLCRAGMAQHFSCRKHLYGRRGKC